MDFDTRSRIKPELNMAPLIDVVFLLLIFFMLTSNMVKLEAINLELPSSGTANSIEKKLINVSLLANGSYFLDKTAITAKDLSTKLKKLFADNPSQAIILSVEKTANAQGMVTAMDLIRNSGGSNISLATK